MSGARVAGFLLICALLAAPASGRADALEDCLDSTEVIGDCLAHRQLESIRRHERVSEKVRLLAEQHDAPGSDSKAQAALLAAEQAFDAYVEAACKASGLLGRGSRPVTADDRERACKIDLLDARADALESLVQAEP